MKQTNGVMERLKSETRAHHEAAENQALQKALVAGRLGRETYVRYLGQMLTVHRVLESQVRSLIESRPELKNAVRDHNFREADLIRDLTSLGADPEAVAPQQPAAELVADMERLGRENAIALMGMHYVLEGANNGNRYVARSMQKALGSNDHQGVCYLDPYGEAQRERWQEYKTAMAGMAINEDEADAIVDAAKRMFEAIGEISREIALTTGLPASSAAEEGASAL